MIKVVFKDFAEGLIKEEKEFIENELPPCSQFHLFSCKGNMKDCHVKGAFQIGIGENNVACVSPGTDDPEEVEKIKETIEKIILFGFSYGREVGRDMERHRNS